MQECGVIAYGLNSNSGRHMGSVKMLVIRIGVSKMLTNSLEM